MGWNNSPVDDTETRGPALCAPRQFQRDRDVTGMGQWKSLENHAICNGQLTGKSRIFQPAQFRHCRSKCFWCSVYHLKEVSSAQIRGQLVSEVLQAYHSSSSKQLWIDKSQASQTSRAFKSHIPQPNLPFQKETHPSLRSNHRGYGHGGGS